MSDFLRFSHVDIRNSSHNRRGETEAFCDEQYCGPKHLLKEGRIEKLIAIGKERSAGYKGR